MRATLAALLLLASATVPVSAPAADAPVGKTPVGETSVREALYVRSPEAEAVARSGDRPPSMFSAAIFEATTIRVGPAVLRGVHPANLSDPRLPARALRFKRTWKVEKDVRQRLLDSLLRTTSDPEDREQIEESVADGAIWREFDRTLGFAGYSSSNLADATTAYYVITWQVVSGEQAIDYLAGIRVVRDSVALALLRDPEVADMSDADKQEAAVVMAYKAIAAAHRARELRSSNDRSGLERLRRDIRDSVALGQGVDLAALRLTNKGFVTD